MLPWQSQSRTLPGIFIAPPEDHLKPVSQVTYLGEQKVTGIPGSCRSRWSRWRRTSTGSHRWWRSRWRCRPGWTPSSTGPGVTPWSIPSQQSPETGLQPQWSHPSSERWSEMKLKDSLLWALITASVSHIQFGSVWRSDSGLLPSAPPPPSTPHTFTPAPRGSQNIDLLALEVDY